jgi:mono/diheme cytochrome c family protein
MKRALVCLTLVLILIVVTAACGGTAPTATPQPTAVAQPPTPVSQMPQQQASGKALFGQHCSPCHAADMTGGTGPALSAAGLSKYSTAQGLFDKVSKTMPRSNPASLTTQQYYDLVDYLLVAQGLLKPDQTVNADTLATISLKQ